MATRKHGRNGRLYMALTSGGTAEPVAFLKKWSVSLAVDKADATAFGDRNKISLAGLPDGSGSYEGFIDTDSVQTLKAAIDGVARKFYLYEDASVNTRYFGGTAIFDAEEEVAVDGVITLKGSFAPQSDIIAPHLA